VRRSAHSDCAWAAAIALAIGLATMARASHLDVAITVVAGKVEARGAAHEQPTGARPAPKREIAPNPPMLTLRAGEEVVIRWFVKNVQEQPAPQTLVHCFVKDAARAEMADPTDATRGSVWENAFVMDLAPKQSASGMARFSILTPGDFIAEIETLNSASGMHEHFSRVLIRVEAASP